MSSIKFCYLKKKDKFLVFRWRNSANVNHYLLKKKINLNEHNQWFLKRLKKNNCFAWIVFFKKEKIGMVQLEKLKEKTCNAGFYIVKKKIFLLNIFNN